MIEKLGTYLPIVGIVSFSLCSAWALFNLFNGNAQHPTWLYALPAILVELVAAGAIHMLVERFKLLTLSKQSKQDRRFNLGITGALLVLAAIPLLVSTWANSVEFGGLVLGMVFPTCTVTCALLAAIPHVVGRYEATRQQDRDNKAAGKKQREKDRKAAATREQALESLGKARETLEAIAENPKATHEQIAATVGISRRTVGNHLGKLEEKGLIKRNGNGLEIV